ncbi:MIR domain protein [Ichthyophthirius multifiliis]|uniref:MIR domain protein n=1 Tax=Ichthyophthirius multifiliis TaxID=5932 RepID=G0QWW7_ICHMU|nr:MIR domain protein [Ichthyophthirius multifiliis]EGR30288.1 MIR domain protein [Ichthyophthirius multifiliis]|eukprot:XP_004031875.1 MIR domain protein [Ichthyophthirius multifiliis]
MFEKQQIQSQNQLQIQTLTKSIKSQISRSIIQSDQEIAFKKTKEIQNVLPIKYGDTISISPATLENKFMMSDGFIQTKIQIKNLNFDGNGAQTERCLFRIYPQFNFSYLNNLNNKQQISFKKDKQISNQCLNLEREVIIEYKQNLDLYEKIKGTEVQFNTSIQLMHVASNKFLCCNYQEQSNIEKENFCLDLQQFSNLNTLFQFKQCYEHQKRADNIIYYRDIFYLICQNKYLQRIPFVHYSEERKQNNETQLIKADDQIIMKIQLDHIKEKKIQVNTKGQYLAVPQESQIHIQNQNRENNDQMQTQNISYKQLISRKSENIEKFKNSQKRISYEDKNQQIQEANVSLEAKTQWKAIKYSDNIQNEDLLQFGDKIWLNYIEKGQNLVTKRTQKGQIILQMENFEQSDQQSINYSKKYEGNTNGMWVIENKVWHKGGPVQWGQYFYLRNFSTGLYLSVLFEKSQNFFQYILKTNSFPDESSLFSFLQVDFTGQPFVTKYSLLFIKNRLFDGIIQIGKEDSTQLKVTDFQADQDNEQIFFQGNLQINIYKGKNLNENAFKIYKATIQEVEEANFLNSCLPILNQCIKILKSINGDKVKAQKAIKHKNLIENINMAKQCIIDISKFCQNKLIVGLDNYSSSGSHINTYRQKVLAEQYFIDLVVDLVVQLMNDQELQEYVNFLKIERTNKFIQKLKNYMKLQKINIEKFDNQLQLKNKCLYKNSQENQQLFQFMKVKVEVIKLSYNLLTFICQNNVENQKNVFYQKITHFKFQARYLKESIHCIVDIISNNEIILSNLTDNINILNKNRKSLSKNFPLKKQFSKEIQIQYNNKDNVVVYLLNLFQYQKKFIHLLKFFRQICKFDNKGISINQELIYKFLQSQENLENKMFLLIKINSQNQLEVQIDKNLYIINEEICGKNIKINSEIQYLIEQINFYADLSLSRNYLWNKYLEKKFPIQFILQTIFNENLHSDFRSAFCNLLLTVYIDREPLNILIVPQMCRTFNQKANILSPNSHKEYADIYNNFSFVQHRLYFEQLISYSDEYIKKQKIIINNDKCDKLTFNIVKILSTLLRFNVLQLLDKKSLYPIIFSSLIGLLETDQQNNDIINHVQKIRNIKYTKQLFQQNQNKIIAGICCVTKKVKQLTAEMLDVTQNLTQKTLKIMGNLIGITYRKKKILNEELSQYDEQVLSQNPLLGGLLQLLQIIKEGENHELKQANVQVEIKQEICNLVLFFHDMRIDYLLTNFIEWFGQISNLTAQQMEKELKGNSIQSTIPNISKTGIDEIDIQYKPKQLPPWFLRPFVHISPKNKKKQFVDYTDFSINQFDDLDTLITGVQILPSLLITFYLASDSKLEDKILEIIIRQFSQCEMIFTKLQEIEILFSDKDIFLYQLLKNRIQQLQVMAEKSEVWFMQFQENIKQTYQGEIVKNTENNLEINKIIQILDEINSLFFSGSEVNGENNKIQTSQFYEYIQKNIKNTSYYQQQQIMQFIPEQINKNRQKIFRYLEGHIPIINLIKDVQNQICQYLRDQNLQKDLILSLLEKLYSILKHFCINNSENQQILVKYIPFFIDEISFDFGQFELIKAIYENNKFLCENFFNGTFFNQILVIIKQYGRQARFIEILGIIQKYTINKQTISLIENQINVYNLLIPLNQKHDKKNLENVLFGQLDSKNQLRFDFSLLEEDEDDDQNTVFNQQSNTSYEKYYIDQPFLYHSVLLNIFSQCVNGDEAFNINQYKLVNIFSLQYLIRILVEKDSFLLNQSFLGDTESYFGFFNRAKEIKVRSKQQGFNYLKPKILSLILNVFLNKNNPLLSLIMQEHNQIIEFIEIEINRFITIPNAQLYSVNDQYLEYFIESFVYFLIQFINKVIKNGGNQNEELLQKQYFQYLSQLGSYLVDQQNLLCQKITKFQQNIIFEFLLCLNIDSNTFTNNKVNNMYEILIKEGKKKLSFENQQNIYEEIGEEILKNQTSNKKFTQIEWKIFIKKCLENPHVKNCQEKEITALAECLLDVEKLYDRKIIFKDFFKKFICYLKNGIINKVNQNNMIYLLKILEKILDISPNYKGLGEMQNLFDQLEATKMFLELISDIKENPFDDNLFIQLLSFMIKLIEGGNQKVQNTIYNYFINHQKSEDLFNKFFTILTDQINNINKSFELKNFDFISMDSVNNEQEEFQNLVLNTMEKSTNIQEIQEKNNKEQEENYSQSSVLVVYLLRLLQLLCEGHNLQLQNYLRYQVNNRNSYDIITIIVDVKFIFFNLGKKKKKNIQSYQKLFEQFVNKLNKRNFQNTIKCIDTLTEFVQGPCYLNQEKIIDSKFLEIAQFILNKQIKKKFIKKQDQDIQRWQLEKLKYKIMILVAGCLELNSNTLVIKRVMRSLPLQTLKKIQLIYTEDIKNYMGINIQ